MKTTYKYFCIALIGLVFLNPSFSQTPEQTYLDWAALPFSKNELEERRNKLIQLLDRQGENGVVMIPSRDGFSNGETFRQLDDFYYFTGLELPNSILVLDVQENLVEIHVPERDSRFENGSRPNDFPGRPLLSDMKLQSESGLTFRPIAELENRLKSITKSNRKILVNGNRPGLVPGLSNELITTFSAIQTLIRGLRIIQPELSFKNIYGSIASIRMIKSEAEIQLLRQAVRITEEGIKEAARRIRPGVSERELEGIMEGRFKLEGAQRLAFGSIIKSGPNSLWPWRILATHYNRRNRNMAAGELVIFDVGSEYNQYVSDVGRTFPVSGKFSERQKEILQMETSVADQIIDFVKPGISFNDVKQLTDKIIPPDAKKYMQVGLFFGHHLGLSTGDPNISSATLQPGMVFTVEPWYYNHDEQISVFTEDVILVTEKGCEVLSSALPRTPDAIEMLMKH